MSKITPFKGRKIDFNKPVQAYRCLNRKGVVFSIKQGGVVRGHTSDLTLKDVVFKISPSGKKRAIETGRRNVHAFVQGYICKEKMLEQSEPASYNPFLDKGFYVKESEKEISNSKYACFSNQGLSVII